MAITEICFPTSIADLPPLSSLGPATGFGSGLYPGTSTADALTDPFAMPPPRLRRSRSRTGSIAMDTDQPDQLGSMPFGRGGRHADASLGPPSGFSEFSNFPTSGPLGNISLAGGSSSPTGDGFPSVTGEGELGPPHASRNLRKPSRRATFSTAQLNIMEDLWAQTEYPSNEQIEACATAAGLVSTRPSLSLLEYFLFEGLHSLLCRVS